MEQDNNVKRIAIFDFCETLVKFQTADGFVNFIYSRTNSPKMLKIENFRRNLHRFRINKILNFFFKLWDSLSLDKKLKLLQLRGFQKSFLISEAKIYYEDLIKTNIITEVKKELILLKEKEYTIGIVSGGLDIYIQYFVSENKIDFCYADKLKFKDGICLGCLEGIDYMRYNKIKPLIAIFKEKNILDSIAYSDSKSDLPLLRWAEKGVVVSKKHQKWIENYNFRELLWKN